MLPPPPVTFHRLIEAAAPPRRADRSGLGTLPTRAYRHCEAVTAAAGFGWHLCPPLDFDLLWEDGQLWWRCPTLAADGLDRWMPLGAAQYPHFAARFAAAAPAGLGEFSPPFLTALPESGVVQIWTGLAARTAPGWSLLLRGLANLPRHPGYDAYEGIVETDHWFGPLFTNLRLTRTGTPIGFHATEPFLQAQPIPQLAYTDAVLNGAALVAGLEGLSATDWADYEATIVAPNRDPAAVPGRYAAAARRRRRSGASPPQCPGSGAVRGRATTAAQGIASTNSSAIRTSTSL